MNHKFGALVNNRTTVFVAVRIRGNQFQDDQKNNGGMHSALAAVCSSHVAATTQEIVWWSWLVVLERPINLNVIPQPQAPTTTRPPIYRSVFFNRTDRQDEQIQQHNPFNHDPKLTTQKDEDTFWTRKVAKWICRTRTTTSNDANDNEVDKDNDDNHEELLDVSTHRRINVSDTTVAMAFILFHVILLLSVMTQHLCSNWYFLKFINHNHNLTTTPMGSSSKRI